MINKNFYRKTNDKKVLHKVGKNWKVISIALLMAIGGGAVASHTANADANANNNYANNATAQDIAGNDSIGNNAVTPKSASSASAKPAKPASAVSYLSGYNGSAASYHAKAQSDEANYKVNSGIVQGYVNSLNNEFPKQTSSLGSALQSATDQTNADQSSADSYSAIAAQSNYSSQVSSLAAKANMTSSAYIESVGASASDFNSEISANSVFASEMVAVNSDAQLVSEINDNSALSTAYVFKAQSANDSASVANAYLVNAKNSLVNAQNLSNSNEQSLVSNKASYDSVATKEAIALANGSSDSAFVQSIANQNSNVNYANSSSVSNVISKIASAVNEASAGNNGAFSLSVISSKDPGALSFNTTSLSQGSTAAESTAYSEAQSSLALHDILSSSNDTANGKTYYTYLALAYKGGNISNVNSNGNTITFAHTASSGHDQAASYSSAALVIDVSDTAAQLTYSTENQSLKAAISAESANVTKYSDGVDNASSAAQSAQNSYDNANSEAIALNALTNNPTLSRLFNSQSNSNVTPTSYTAAQFGDSVLANASVSSAVSSSNNVQGLKNAVEAAVNGAVHSHPVNDDGDVQSDLEGASNAVVSVLSAVESDATAHTTNNMSQGSAAIATNGTLNDTEKSMANALVEANGNIKESAFLSAINSNSVTTGMGTLSGVASNIASTIASVAASQSVGYDTVPVTVYGMLNTKSYQAAHDSLAADGLLTTDNTNLTSNVSSIAASASAATSAYTSASSASASYSAATDESVALASSYANSYSADVQADKTVQSAAQNSLDTFYATHADAKYATASSDAASLSAAVPNDNAYAEGNGLHVFNYGPKYIIVTKAGQLHTKPDYNTADDKVVGKVPAGAQLAVKSVYFGQNGVTRYEVNYDGTTGLFTANSAFSKQAYLPAYSGVDVTLTKNARVYKDANFKEAAGTTYKANQTVKNVNIVTMDHKRNGFTRIETQQGQWFTANTNYVTLDGADSANTNSAESQQLQKSNNPVNFWN